MMLLKYRTFKKAQTIANELKAVPLEEGKLITFLALYLLINDKEMKLKDLADRLPSIFRQTLTEYAIMTVGDKK